VTAEGKSVVFTKLEGVHYKTTVSKQGPSPSLGVTIPPELMISMKLSQGMQCEWTAEGNSLILTPLESFHRTVKLNFVDSVRNFPFNVNVTIPKELAKSNNLAKVMLMQWSVEGEDKFSLKPVESKSPNVVKLRYDITNNSHHVGIPTKIVKSAGLVKGMYGTWIDGTDKLLLEVSKRKAELGAEDTSFINQTKIQAIDNSHIIVIPDEISKKLHLRPGTRGEWFADGEKLSLELRDDYPYILRVMQKNTATSNGVYRSYGEEVSLHIPNAISEAIGLNKNTEVGFRIDDEGRLVITPKPGLPKNLD
jgi:antitoxin component of MazEF toxin-antitoxin module